MSHPIQERIVETRRKAARLSLLYGWSWVAGVLVATIVVLGLADYLIRFHDPGIRALSSLAVLSVLAWTAYRYLYPAWSCRLRDVEIARRIERRFPALQDRLSSAVEFLQQDESDPHAGSAALRRAVIVDTTADVERLNMDDVLERRPARRALAGAAGVLLAALAIVACEPLAARLALARLIRPFGDDAWPRKHELAFIHPPERVAAGQTFEVELCDRNGTPPDDVKIHYLYENDGRPVEEVESMHLLDGVMVARKENVARPFKYRAEGGDDRSMPWISLEVVEPPRIDSLQATIHPPDYTGWPVEQVENNLNALRGTRVALIGTTTKRIKEATVHLPDGIDLAARVSADGYRFELPADALQPFVIDRSGTYSFGLVDVEGLTGGQESLYEIRAVTDQAPSVNIEQPGANVFVTPTAAVSLRVVAKDDLAVRDVELHISRSGTVETPDSWLSLFAGPQHIAPAAGGLALGVGGETRTVEYVWEIAALDLKPGSQVTFYASADDYLPQAGRSTDRRLIIITPQELEDRLAQRQGLILNELRRALKMQQEMRSQTESLEIQLRELGHLGKQDIDHAQGAELSQRQVARTLTSPTEGVPAQIKGLLSDLASNRVDNADVARRMQTMLDEIDRLDSQHLGPIQRELTSAIKGAQVDLADATEGSQPDRPQNPAVGTALGEVAAHQDQVVHSLETMLEDLAQWDSYRRLGRDVAQLDREQEDVEGATRKAAGHTLGKELKDLEPQQVADLKKIGGRQAELGRRFDKLLQQMDEARTRLDESDPLAGATLADALHLPRQRGTSGQMRSAANQVERNQLGQAGGAQQQARRDLAEMLDILANRREHELGRLLKKIREAEQELATLRKQHEGLRKKQSELASAEQGAEKSESQKRQLERLTRQQRELQEQVARLGRTLERLQAERAGRTAGAAAAKIGRQAAAGEKGDQTDSEQQSNQADLDLEQAQEQLAQRRQEIEADLARAQMARLQDSLKSLHDRQQQVLAETGRLDDLHGKHNELSRAQASSLHSLVREQQSLESESRAQAEKLAGAKVFHLALSSAARDMASAAGHLDRGDTGQPAQRAEQDAIARLAALLEAIKPPAKASQPKNSAGEGGQGGGGGTDGVKLLAELKLLKLMQQDLNRRFALLAEIDDEGLRAARLTELGQDQGRLADAALALSKPLEKNPEDDPDHMPALGKPQPDPPQDAPPEIEKLLPSDGVE